MGWLICRIPLIRRCLGWRRRGLLDMTPYSIQSIQSNSITQPGPLIQIEPFCSRSFLICCYCGVLCHCVFGCIIYHAVWTFFWNSDYSLSFLSPFFMGSQMESIGLLSECCLCCEYRGYVRTYNTYHAWHIVVNQIELMNQ